MTAASRLATCASSCAITASSSRGSSRSSRPWVRCRRKPPRFVPSIQLLGIALRSSTIAGFGRSATMHSRSTIACSSGASAGESRRAARGDRDALVQRRRRRRPRTRRRRSRRPSTAAGRPPRPARRGPAAASAGRPPPSGPPARCRRGRGRAAPSWRPVCRVFAPVGAFAPRAGQIADRRPMHQFQAGFLVRFRQCVEIPRPTCCSYSRAASSVREDSRRRGGTGLRAGTTRRGP